MSYKNIVLIGAGGNLGPAILKSFLDSNAFNITILTRQSSKSTFPSSVKVAKVSDDYPSSELEAAFKGQDAVLSFVGGAAIAAQTKFIDAAVKAGVKRFIPSEWGSNLTYPKALQIFPGFQGKVDVVNYLKKQEASGLTWSSIVPGPFFDWCLRTGFTGFDIQAKKATIYDTGDERWSTTTLSTIGRALISILQNPSTTDSTNKYVYIASFTTSQNEVLATLEKVQGAKYTVEKKSTATLIEEGHAKLKTGDFSAFGDLIVGNLYGGEGNDFEKEGIRNDKLGLKPESLEEVVGYVVQGGLAP